MSQPNKGFAPPNYTQTPNALFDLLPDMSEAELKVTLAIARQTFGWHRQKQQLSVTQMARMTGLSEQSVRNGIEAGMGRGTILRAPAGQSFEYQLSVPEEAQNLDPPKESTPLNFRGVGVQNLGGSGVQNLDPLIKKEEKENKERNVVAAVVESSPRARARERPGERQQQQQQMEKISPAEGGAIKSGDAAVDDAYLDWLQQQDGYSDVDVRKVFGRILVKTDCTRTTVPRSMLLGWCDRATERLTPDESRAVVERIARRAKLPAPEEVAAACATCGGTGEERVCDPRRNFEEFTMVCRACRGGSAGKTTPTATGGEGVTNWNTISTVDRTCPVIRPA